MRGVGAKPRGDFFKKSAPLLLHVSPRRFKHQLTQGRGRSSGVEHNLAKVRVVSSNLIARSNQKSSHSRESFFVLKGRRVRLDDGAKGSFTDRHR